MTTVDFITELFCQVDDQIGYLPKHSQARLYPSEVVTLALLYALTGKGNRAFWRWLMRDYQPLFSNLCCRTRLFRLFNSQRYLIGEFLAPPSLLGVIDSYGIELLHPRREGRSAQQIGRKGKSNGRWIVGGKLCFLLDHLGRVVDWECDTANVYEARPSNIWSTNSKTIWSSLPIPALPKRAGSLTTCVCVSAVNGTCACLSRRCSPCSLPSASSNAWRTRLGAISRPASVSPWHYSTS